MFVARKHLPGPILDSQPRATNEYDLSNAEQRVVETGMEIPGNSGQVELLEEICNSGILSDEEILTLLLDTQSKEQTGRKERDLWFKIGREATAGFSEVGEMIREKTGNGLDWFDKQKEKLRGIVKRLKQDTGHLVEQMIEEDQKAVAWFDSKAAALVNKVNDILPPELRERVWRWGAPIVIGTSGAVLGDLLIGPLAGMGTLAITERKRFFGGIKNLGHNISAKELSLRQKGKSFFSKRAAWKAASFAGRLGATISAITMSTGTQDLLLPSKGFQPQVQRISGIPNPLQGEIRLVGVDGRNLGIVDSGIFKNPSEAVRQIMLGNGDLSQLSLLNTGTIDLGPKQLPWDGFFAVRGLGKPEARLTVNRLNLPIYVVGPDGEILAELHPSLAAGPVARADLPENTLDFVQAIEGQSDRIILNPVFDIFGRSMVRYLRSGIVSGVSGQIAQLVKAFGRGGESTINPNVDISDLMRSQDYSVSFLITLAKAANTGEAENPLSLPTPTEAELEKYTGYVELMTAWTEGKLSEDEIHLACGKLMEKLWADWLQAHYSAEDLNLAYLNTVRWRVPGIGEVVGIRSAGVGFFGTESLSQAETLFLTSIIPNPAGYAADPESGVLAAIGNLRNLDNRVADLDQSALGRILTDVLTLGFTSNVWDQKDASVIREMMLARLDKVRQAARDPEIATNWVWSDGNPIITEEALDIAKEVVLNTPEDQLITNIPERFTQNPLADQRLTGEIRKKLETVWLTDAADLEHIPNLVVTPRGIYVAIDSEQFAEPTAPIAQGQAELQPEIFILREPLEQRFQQEILNKLEYNEAGGYYNLKLPSGTFRIPAIHSINPENGQLEVRPGLNFSLSVTTPEGEVVNLAENEADIDKEFGSSLKPFFLAIYLKMTGMSLEEMNTRIKEFQDPLGRLVFRQLPVENATGEQGFVPKTIEEALAASSNREFANMLKDLLLNRGFTVEQIQQELKPFGIELVSTLTGKTLSQNDLTVAFNQNPSKENNALDLAVLGSAGAGFRSLPGFNPSFLGQMILDPDNDKWQFDEVTKASLRTVRSVMQNHGNLITVGVWGGVDSPKMRILVGTNSTSIVKTGTADNASHQTEAISGMKAFRLPDGRIVSFYINLRGSNGNGVPTDLNSIYPIKNTVRPAVQAVQIAEEIANTLLLEQRQIIKGMVGVEEIAQEINEPETNTVFTIKTALVIQGDNVINRLGQNEHRLKQDMFVNIVTKPDGSPIIIKHNGRDYVQVAFTAWMGYHYIQGSDLRTGLVPVESLAIPNEVNTISLDSVFRDRLEELKAITSEINLQNSYIFLSDENLQETPAILSLLRQLKNSNRLFASRATHPRLWAEIGLPDNAVIINMTRLTDFFSFTADDVKSRDLLKSLLKLEVEKMHDHNRLTQIVRQAGEAELGIQLEDNLAGAAFVDLLSSHAQDGATLRIFMENIRALAENNPNSKMVLGYARLSRVQQLFDLIMTPERVADEAEVSELLDLLSSLSEVDSMSFEEKRFFGLLLPEEMQTWALEQAFDPLSMQTTAAPGDPAGGGN